jgi:hypothetical protein
MFCPEPGWATTSNAKAICAACPVITRCATECDLVEATLAPSALTGVVAGETRKERIKRRAAVARPAAA